MADSAALLRMLEPAVRPVQGPANPASPAAPARPQPGESFDALLDQAQQQNLSVPDNSQSITEATPDASADKQANPANPANPLGPLAQLDAVENASLRTIIEQSNAVKPADDELDHG